MYNAHLTQATSVIVCSHVWTVNTYVVTHWAAHTGGKTIGGWVSVQCTCHQLPGAVLCAGDGGSRGNQDHSPALTCSARRGKRVLTWCDVFVGATCCSTRGVRGEQGPEEWLGKLMVELRAGPGQGRLFLREIARFPCVDTHSNSL